MPDWKEYFKDYDWEDYFEEIYQSRESADKAAAKVKAINVLGEAGIPGAKGLMEFIDQRAYNIASQRSSSGRERIDVETGEGEYVGGTSSKAPNILKMFLGMEENILPESEDRPTSWTKGDPEQGWRSIRDFSTFEMYEEGDPIRESKFNYRTDEYKSSVNKRIQKMREAVSGGEYTPEMAVKAESFPGLGYRSKVDLGGKEHYTTSIGYDQEKAQYYFSVSDIWDFDPEQYVKLWSGFDPGFSDIPAPITTEEYDENKLYAQASLMQASGKPIGLYDRYYLPESYMTDWFGELGIEDQIIGDMKRTDKGILGESNWLRRKK